MSAPLDIVDVHTQLRPPAWGPGGKIAKPAGGFSPEIYRKITTPSALVDEFKSAGVSLAVVTATIESLFGAEGPVDFAGIAEANNWLASLVAAEPSLAAFAVTDVFSGEEGAAEAERAIVDLGLSGLVIDSSRNGKFLADPSARPTLEVAARHRVPVFVHPVAHPNSEVLIAGAGMLGNSSRMLDWMMERNATPFIRPRPSELPSIPAPAISTSELGWATGCTKTGTR